MADRRITYQIDFRTNLNNLNNLKRELQDLQRLSSNDLMSGMTKGTKATLDDVRKLHKTVTQVDVALEKAFNARLGTTNVSVFNNELKKSGLTLQQIANTFNMAGVQGQNAFRNLANQVMTNNTQLKETTNFMTKIQTTLANTLKWNLSSSVINQLTGTIQQAYGYVQHLDRSLNDIRVVTGLSADEMKEFAVQANDAAKALGAGTTDYTEASLIYFQQGKTSEESQQLADVTLKAANVTGQSAAEVSEELTAVWNGYQVSAEQAELYVDKLAAVAATTASDLEELSTGMSKVASAANAMGVDVDSLNAQLATIISVTRQAPESVGTALKTIYARMGDIEAGLDDEISLGGYTSKMADLGVNVLDANDELRNMGEVIDEVGGKWETMSREQQIALAQIMAGTRQYNNLVALFDNWDMYTQAIETSAHAAGTLQEQQDIYMQSTAAHLQTLRTTWEDVYDSVLSTELLNPAIDGITKFVDIIGSTIDSIGGSESVFIGLGALITKVFSEEAGKAFSAWRNNVNYAKAATQEFTSRLEFLEEASHIKGLDEANSNFIRMKVNLEKLSTSLKPDQYRQLSEEFNRLDQAMNQLADFQAEKSNLASFASELTKTKVSFDQFAKDFEQIKAAFAGIDFNRLNDQLADFNIMWEASSRIGPKYFVDSSGEIPYLRQALESTIAQISNSDIQARYRAEMQKLFSFDGLDDSGIRARITQIQNFINNFMRNVNTIVTDETTTAVQTIETGAKQASKTVNNVASTTQQSLNSVTTQNFVANIMNGVSAMGTLAMSINSISNLGNIFDNDNINSAEKMLQVLTNIGFTAPMLVNTFKTLAQVTNRVSFKELADVKKAQAAADVAFGAVQTEKETKRVAMAMMVQAKQMTAAEAEAALRAKNTVATAAETKATELNTIAKQKAEAVNTRLNASLLSSPYALVAVAVAALAVVIGTQLVKAQQKAREETAKASKELVESTQKMIDAKKEELKAIEEIKKSYEELNEKYKDGETSVEEMRSTLYDLYVQHGMLNEAVQVTTASYSELGKQLDENQKKILDEELALQARNQREIQDTAHDFWINDDIKTEVFSGSGYSDFFKDLANISGSDAKDFYYKVENQTFEPQVSGTAIKSIANDLLKESQKTYSTILNKEAFLQAYIQKPTEIMDFLNKQIKSSDKKISEIASEAKKYLDNSDLQSLTDNFDIQSYYTNIAKSLTFDIQDSFSNFQNFEEVLNNLEEQALSNEDFGLTEEQGKAIRDAIVKEFAKNSENAEYILKDSLIQAIAEAGKLTTNEIQNIIAGLSLEEAEALQLDLPVVIKLISAGVDYKDVVNEYKKIAEQTNVISKQFDIKTAFEEFINTKDIDASINGLFAKYDEIVIGTQTFTKEVIDGFSLGEKADFLRDAYKNVTHDLSEERKNAQEELQQIQDEYEEGYRGIKTRILQIQPTVTDDGQEFGAIDFSKTQISDKETQDKILKFQKELNEETLVRLFTSEELTDTEKAFKEILEQQYGINEANTTEMAHQYLQYKQIGEEILKASTIKINPFDEINAESTKVHMLLDDAFNQDELIKKAEELQKKLEKSNGKIDLYDEESKNTFYEIFDKYPEAIEKTNGKLKIHVEALKAENKSLREAKQAAEENLKAATNLRKEKETELDVLKEQREAALESHASSGALIGLNEKIAEKEKEVTKATEAETEARKENTVAQYTSIVASEDTYKNLSESLSNISSAYQTLSPAVKDFNDGGKLSLSSLSALLTTGYEYADCLTYENGQIKLSKEALKEKALKSIDEAKATVRQQIATDGYNESLHNQLVLLDQLYDDVESDKMDLFNNEEIWKDWEAPDIDKTQDLASALERIEDKIKDLQEEEKKLSGEDLLNNLAEQKKLLEDKAKKQEEYVNLLKDEQKLQQNKNITLKDKTNNKSTSVTLRGMGAQFDEDGNLLNRVSLEQRAVQNVQSHAWTPEQYNQFISALDDYTKATDNWAKAVDDHNKIADEIDETDIKTAEADANTGEDKKKSILESTAYTIDNLTKEYEDLQDAEKALSGNELINHYKTESQILDDLNSKLKTQKQHYEDLAKEDKETLFNKFDAKFDEDGNIANLKELMDSSEWKIIEKYVESYNENLKQARDIGKQINQNRDALVEKEKESINVLDEEISKLEDERQKLEESLEDVAPEDAGEKLGQIGNIIDKEISKLKEEESVLLNNIKLWRARAIEAAFKGDANAAAYWLNQIKEANFDLKDINNRLEEIKDTSESVDLFSQLDKAYSVNRELSKIERQLGRMQKAQDGLEGDELIKNLQQQQVLIQREIALMNKKIQIQTKDLKIAQSKLKVTLATLAAEEGLNLNVKFDSQTGEIENYLEVLSGIQNLSEPVFNSIQSIMDAINSSATDILDLRDNLEDLQYDYQDTADAIFEEQQRLIEESKKTEEEIVEEVEDATDALEEELARRLKLFHAEIDVNIDANEAQRQLDALQRKLDGLKDTDILGNAQAALDDFKSYYGSIGDIDLLAGHVNDIMGEIEIMKSGLASSLYGTDIEAAFDDLANYRDQLLSSLEAMQELVKQVEDSYLQQIDKISSKISDQISNYNQITSMIEHDSNLIKLLRGDDEYKKLANYYKQLETNYNAELGFLKKEVDYWRDKMESVEEGSEEWEKYQQEWKNAVSEFNSTVDSAVQNVIDKYKNAVNDIFDNWQKKLTGGFKLDDVAERWELAKKASDMYLDSVEKGYELQVLENKYRESINNTDDIEQQQQLNALMEERLKKLREQDKLSQYDIDRANLEYEMTLKQIALEESRNNKTSMRLRRDSQGNYRYEYVANEEDVIEKQQELLDLQNQIYELDKDKYRTNLDEVISIYQEFQNKLYDLYSDQTLTEEERELKKKQLIEDYGAIINNYIADNEAIRQNLQQSSFDMLEDLYAEDAVKFQNMTQQEIDDAMGILIPGWDGIIQQMIDSFAGAGGLAPSCEEALNDLGLVTQDYEQSLADIEQAANISFGDIISGVDQTIPAMGELISTNEELLDKYDQELQAIADLIDQLHALQDAYASTTQAALDAIQAAIDLGREAASTLNELQALTGATSNANSQANALNQAQQNGSGEDTRDMRATPTFGHAVVRFNKVVDKNTGKTGFIKHGDIGSSQFYENIDDFYSGHGTTVNTSDLINADTGRKYDERDKWSFATGGYTGEWGPEGRAAILHEKELVLNKTDTDNILKAVFALRDYAKNQFNFNPFAMLMDSIKSNLQSNLFNLIPNLSAASAIDSPSSALSQNVHIDASFPNVQSSNEIEQAINNLVNTASQYILNNNR